MAASYKKRRDSWEVASIDPPHSCTAANIAQDHRKLGSDLICQDILPMVNKDPSVKVSIIISHIVTRYNYTPSYKKAWIARTKAVEKVYGNWEDSYKELPRYLTSLKTYAPGTVAILETLPAGGPDGTLVGGNRIFNRLFWAFKPCIKGFSFCKPIIQIDGTWLYSKYKGTLLMAVAQDGNNNVFPIAFSLVEGETAGGWGFFLKNLRRHVAPQSNLCLISERHASIESAYNNPKNGWHNPPSTHVYCIRHITQNFMRAIRDRHLRKKVVNAGYALTRPTFQYYLNEIRMSNAEAGAWLDNIPLEKWTRAFDGGCRWGHMTTNLVESMNGVFKGIRNRPVTALVRATYFRMASLFAIRGKRWSAVSQSGQLFSESCMKVMKDESIKASTHAVTVFDRHRLTFSVQETMDHNEGRPNLSYAVRLSNGWCDCGKFQAFRMPCSHVIAACAYTRWDAYSHLSNVYRVDSLMNVYNKCFHVVAMEEYWPPYEGDIVWHNEEMRRKKKGHPNNTRIQTEMDTMDKMIRKCSICRQPGHNRKHCPNVGGTSTT